MRRIPIVLLVLVLASLIAASVSHAAPTRIPGVCRSHPAKRLCAIHWHHHRANTYRREAGMHPIPYQWIAEAHPARRGRILAYWIHVQARSHKQLKQVLQARAREPWLSNPFHAQAMCIHQHESINWHDPGSPGGGMQFMQGTWDNSVVRGYQFASTPAGATPDQQLEAAYRLVRYDGNWHEWTTAPMCGL